MANLIDKLNRLQEEKAGKIIARLTGDPFEPYERRRREGTRYETTFAMSSPEGDLYYIDENHIKVILPAESLQKTDRYYDKWRRGFYVGVRVLEVSVDHVDREKGEVILKSGRVTEGGVRAVKAELFEEVKRRGEILKKGEVPEPFLVYGTVFSVNAERTEATVRLFNQNVFGKVSVSHWAKNYVRKIPEGVEADGLPRPFHLTGLCGEGLRFFRLSAKVCGEDAWEIIPEEMLKVKSVWEVQCIECPKDKKHWWGFVQGLGLEVIGNYTEKFRVREGGSYVCTLKRTDDKYHSVIVTPFRELDRPNKAGEVVTKEEYNALIEEIRQRKAREAVQEGMQEGSGMADG